MPPYPSAIYMKAKFGIPVLLAGLAGISPLKAASPSPAPSPSPTQPASASSKNPAAAREDVESQSRKRGFLDPLGDFARDSILRPKAPFELVPGKDPNGWSFMLEPYGWAMGLDGDIDVKGLPAVNIDIDARKILQHLDWGIFARGEIRKGRWGLLGDGFYAKLSGVGDLGGVLYSSGSLTVKQGLAQLALAYRIIDDRRGFLDFYAGARYNYLGVSVSLNIDEGGIQDLSENVTQRIASRARAGVQSAVSGEEQKLQVLNQETAILEEDVRDRIARDWNLISKPGCARIFPATIRCTTHFASQSSSVYREALAASCVLLSTLCSTNAMRKIAPEQRPLSSRIVPGRKHWPPKQKLMLRLVSLRPKRGSRKPSLRASRTPCQLPAPEMSGGSIRLSVFGGRLTSHAGCSWPRRGMWVVLGRAPRSPGSFKRPSESISPATSSRSLAIATCMSTTRTAICSIK